MDFEIEEVRDLHGAWPEIEALVLALIEHHRPWDPRQLRADWAQRMREYLSGPDILVLVARASDGEAVGFVDGRVNKDFGIFEETFGYLNNAFVRPHARRSGAGTALLKDFESWCRKEGATTVSLNVMAANELGLGFWTNAGFVIDSHRMTKGLERQ